MTDASMIAEKKEEDPRVRRTRQLLEQAFLELVAEKDIRSISVRDIAQRATVNRATFYAHFEDKYALLEYCIRDRFAQVLAGKLPANSGIGDLPLLVATVLEYLAGVHHRIRRSDRQFYPLIEMTVQRELSALLLAWLKKASPGGDPDRDSLMTTATVLSWAILGAGMEWGSGARPLSADEMTDQVVAVIAGGLSRVLHRVPRESSRKKG